MALLAQSRFRIEETERQLMEPPAVGRIALTRNTVPVRHCYKQRASRFKYAMALFHRRYEILQMLQQVLGDDLIRRRILPRPWIDIEIMHHVNTRKVYDVVIHVALAYVATGAQINLQTPIPLLIINSMVIACRLKPKDLRGVISNPYNMVDRSFRRLIKSFIILFLTDKVFGFLKSQQIRFVTKPVHQFIRLAKRGPK